MRTDIDLAEFNKTLEAMRITNLQRLEQEIKSLQTYSDSNPDILDGSVKSMVQGGNMRWIGYLRGRKNQIEEALQRINSGQYGICTRCGKDINLDRLKVKPYARYCIMCKKKIE